MDGWMGGWVDGEGREERKRKGGKGEEWKGLWEMGDGEWGAGKENG